MKEEFKEKSNNLSISSNSYDGHEVINVSIRMQ